MFLFLMYFTYTVGMSMVEDKVNALLDKVRPYVQTHGGDVVLARVESGTVYLKLYGACAGCGLAEVTYNKNIGPLLIQEIEEVEEVIFE